MHSGCDRPLRDLHVPHKVLCSLRSSHWKDQSPLNCSRYGRRTKCHVQYEMCDIFSCSLYYCHWTSLTHVLVVCCLLFVVVCVGWGVTEVVATRVVPLWVDAKGVEFSWNSLQIGLDTNITMVCVSLLTCTLYMALYSGRSYVIYIVLLSLLCPTQGETGDVMTGMRTHTLQQRLMHLQSCIFTQCCKLLLGCELTLPSCQLYLASSVALLWLWSRGDLNQALLPLLTSLLLSLCYSPLLLYLITTYLHAGVWAVLVVRLCVGLAAGSMTLLLFGAMNKLKTQ